MLNYDVIFYFEDGSTETSKVSAMTRGTAFATALYSMRDWDVGKQDQVLMAEVIRPHLERPHGLRRPGEKS